MIYSSDIEKGDILEDDMALGYANGYGKNRLGRRSLNNNLFVLGFVIGLLGMTYYLIFRMR